MAAFIAWLTGWAPVRNVHPFRMNPERGDHVTEGVCQKAIHGHSDVTMTPHPPDLYCLFMQSWRQGCFHGTGTSVWWRTNGLL